MLLQARRLFDKDELTAKSQKFVDLWEEITGGYKNRLWVDKIPTVVSYRQVYTKITVDDYYVQTAVTFKTIYPDTVDVNKYEDIEKFWEEIKKKGKFKQSPLSNSEYVLVGTDIYRFSNHWGKVASCMWGLTGLQNGVWDIGKANIKDFKIVEGSDKYPVGNYVTDNPEYTEKVIPVYKEALKKLEQLKKDYVLKVTALKQVDTEINYLQYNIKRTQD